MNRTFCSTPSLGGCARYLAAVFYLAVLAALGQDPPRSGAPKLRPEGYVGSATCKTCHADVWFSFYKNAHFKSIASGKETPEHTGCEGCHGPGKAHVAAGGGKTTIPRAFSLMKPQEVIDTCLGCHSRDLARATIRRSE